MNVLGTAPTAALLSAPNPQVEVPNLLASQVFIDRFSSFINAKFNPEPGYSIQEANYWLARKILKEGKPWKDLFVGEYGFVVPPNNVAAEPEIVADLNGLGYFMSAAWRGRYQGNELQGYRLVHAYRVLNNVLGFELKAAVNTNGVDSQGRKSASCSGCHYHPSFGLDLIARVLPKRGQTFAAEAPQVLLGWKTITDERTMVMEMVASPDFRFNTCRLATQYAYGRSEFKCEGPVFDACMVAFATTPTMQSALSAILRHPTYCQ